MHDSTAVSPPSQAVTPRRGHPDAAYRAYMAVRNEAIRARYAAGDVTLTQIGAEFGLTYSAVAHIVKGRRGASAVAA